MSPHDRDTALQNTRAHAPRFDSLYESMYDRMIERLYMTSSTRFIPRYTLEAARLKHWMKPEVDEYDLNGAPDR